MTAFSGLNRLTWLSKPSKCDYHIIPIATRISHVQHFNYRRASQCSDSDSDSECGKYKCKLRPEQTLDSRTNRGSSRPDEFRSHMHLLLCLKKNCPLRGFDEGRGYADTKAATVRCQHMPGRFYPEGHIWTWDGRCKRRLDIVDIHPLDS